MKPIIFSTENVKALLDGRKTMARLPIKHQPDKSAQFKQISCGWACFEIDIGMWNIMLPHQPGDVLWVRETFARHNKGVAYKADSDQRKIKILKGFWEPPLHMPREDARLFLRVTDVRVERVQDISEEDAIREGIMYTDFGMNEDMGKLSVDGGETFHELKPRHYPGYHAGGATNPSQCVYTARSAFAGEWDDRNAKRGYGWDTNPFCWVIEFKRIEKGTES